MTAIIMLAVAAFSLVACNNNPDEDKEGVLCKSINGVYTVYKYNTKSGETTLNLADYLGEHEDVRIKANAFYGNSSLIEIIVPATVTLIDEGAFAGMKGLQKITLPFIGKNNTGDMFFHQSASAEDKAVDAARTFGYLFGTENYTGGVSQTASFGSDTRTYYAPQNLKEVVVNPAEDYGLPMYAFYGSTLLDKVTLSDKVVNIGEYAFANSSIKSMTLGANFSTVYKNAFESCDQLASFTVNNLVKLGDYALKGTTALAGISFAKTKAEWKAVVKGSGYRTDSSINSVACSDGELSGDDIDA